MTHDGSIDVILERDRVSGDGSEVGGFVTGEPPSSAAPPVLPAVPDVLVAGPAAGAGFEADKPRPRWSIAWFAFAAVFALTGATALVLPHVAPVFGAGKEGVTAAAAGSRGAVACVVDRGDPGYCLRFARDVARRAPLTADERRLGEPEARQLDAVVRRAYPSPGEAPADALRAALAGAGYTGSVVRVARPDDPAPAGSVLFAVPIGAGCVVGHTDAGRGTATSALVGQLPGGTCLSG